MSRVETEDSKMQLKAAGQCLTIMKYLPHAPYEVKPFEVTVLEVQHHTVCMHQLYSGEGCQS
jgi:hypothetical protein